MPISPGARLGSYEVLSPLGAGGMGEVYKARDTRLDRTVAIKVLPSHLADKPQLRERFEREARAVASLNHPHICTLYDIGQQDGIHFLVMEYLEGETLAQRLDKGPLPLNQVLQYATEIADALDKAHRQGVTHRDLKPGNIMLTKAGSKLLDFGLAKLKQQAAPDNIPFSQLPTAKDSLTVEGTILGTLQYMAPEQVEGKVDEVDARTDIFAFGAVVYEMATGKKAFEGSSTASVMSKIMQVDPPPMSSLQPMTPPAMDRVVKKCLAKGQEDRWQSAKDLHDELKWIAEGSSQMALPTAAAIPARTGWRRVLLGGLACLVLGALLASITVLSLWRAEMPAAQSPRRFTINLPQTDQLVKEGLALSPDGRQLVYIGQRAGVNQLYRRSMDQLEASPIPGTDGARWPFFSPDGEWVGFFSGGKLKKVPLGGGSSVTISDVTSIQRGASWGPDDTILFAVFDSGLFRVPAAGGKPEPLTTLDTSQEIQHMWPDTLPGGQAALFSILRSGAGLQSTIVVQSLKTGQRKILLEGTNPRFVPTGHIVFARAGSLWAVPFDAETLEVTGSPAPVGEGIEMDESWEAHFTLANDGTLVYIPGTPYPMRRLVWVDRNGAAQPVSAPLRPYTTPRLSPDGQRLALGVRGENPDVWIYDLARGSLTRTTFDPGGDESPVWMPDGKRLVFAGDRTGIRKLLSKSGDGSGTEEELLGSRGGHRHAEAVSPDSQFLAFTEVGPKTGTDIWVTPIHGDNKPTPFLQTAFSEMAAAFSPDGRWIAYMSNESGRNEVYVQAFPGPGGKWQISTEGGQEPVWARNGRELFYRNGEKMMAVDVTMQPTFSAGTPGVLFEGRYESLAWLATNYDVTADGQRFLMIQASETATTQINVVLNWFEELKEKVPTGN